MPSHGSLTKAGKVRNATPKMQKKEKHKEVPRVRNRLEYEKRVLKSGQQSRAVAR
ncbi:30S ribosomal protein S30e [Sulfolobus acidocaldarius]|uniref:30S ribosomal protein S30E n=4 Tax=Sulfolobus acidocaldarius TaxID=2285 RepID=Q4J957_SULAC|nr:30S ribosomal protein S30e [Sulfolobus acidocaldarius]AAY80683.1 30S ribosomal protein S30E [Sulfolobus acidocaldarius DSM 639]AGE71280.1 30S ribosomal protein S30e [Sulfolobus acidocaldarius N8]AGE73549.1 30S ribosomal protein S30e [Sulfolobus acidocaldarius Ron12/I]ALU30459.1 30S ribosomal protein S30 [Sulfolobus acidocaldarius]ALU31181.1 30S ribosomal protein S30 [Sulfolobus acidocaldarius]